MSREEHKLKVFENRVLRRILGNDESDAVYREQENGGNFIVRSLIICTHPRIIIRQIKSRKMGCAGHLRGERSVQGFGGLA
jgi:hypothetical protein